MRLFEIKKKMAKNLLYPTIITFIINTLILSASTCTFLFKWADLGNWYSFMMYVSLISCMASAVFAFMSVRSLSIMIAHLKQTQLHQETYTFYTFTTCTVSCIAAVMIVYDFEYGTRTIMRAPLPELIAIISAHVFFNFISCLLVVHDIVRKT